jgi:hypothetical protein
MLQFGYNYGKMNLELDFKGYHETKKPPRGWFWNKNFGFLALYQ